MTEFLSDKTIPISGPANNARAEGVTTTDDYQWLRLSARNAPILLTSWRVDNQGTDGEGADAETVEYLLLAGPRVDEPEGHRDLRQLDTGTVEGGAVGEPDDARGLDTHHQTIYLGVRSDASGVHSEGVRVRLEGSV